VSSGEYNEDFNVKNSFLRRGTVREWEELQERSGANVVEKKDLKRRYEVAPIMSYAEFKHSTLKTTASAAQSIMGILSPLNNKEPIVEHEMQPLLNSRRAAS
jgi:hypothetical protein